MRADPATRREALAPARFRPRAAARERLQRALQDLARNSATIRHHSEREWASATFSGSRHRITLGFAGAAAVAAGERFIADLPDHEFTIPGQIMADAVIQAVEHRLLPEPELTLTCELLLLADT